MEITPPEDREICRSIDFAPRGPRDCPRAISRAEGCKINAEANLSVLGGRNFQYIPPLVSVILFYIQITKLLTGSDYLVLLVITQKIVTLFLQNEMPLQFVFWY